MGTKYKGVFFDADDTLFDYPRAERAALRACLREFRLAVGLGTFLDAYRRHNHDVWREFERGEIDQAALRVERFRRVAGELGLSDPPLAAISVFYLEALSGQPYLLPGALTTVRSLARTYPFGFGHQRHRLSPASALCRLAHHSPFPGRGHLGGGRPRQTRSPNLRVRPPRDRARGGRSPLCRRQRNFGYGRRPQRRDGFLLAESRPGSCSGRVRSGLHHRRHQRASELSGTLEKRRRATLTGSRPRWPSSAWPTRRPGPPSDPDWRCPSCGGEPWGRCRRSGWRSRRSSRTRTGHKWP